VSTYRVSVSEITIFSLYLFAAGAYSFSRLPNYAHLARPLYVAAWVAAAIGLLLHGELACSAILVGTSLNLTLSNAINLIGLELVIVAMLASLDSQLRGISAGLLVLAAVTALLPMTAPTTPLTPIDWQIRAHVMTSILSYGILTVGAIVALFALFQERRLRAGKLTGATQLFAPLETTERLLFALAGLGFAGLLLAIVSGLTFVENLFAQHLAHKTAISLLALCVFGALLLGRIVAGWRGMRAIKLYFSGFLLLCLAYFGPRLILEQLLQRSWG